MLRVFTFDEPATLKIRLEGILDQSSLPQYYAVLSKAGSACRGRKVLVDVGDLTLEGSEAESAVRRSIQTGTHFVAPNQRFAELMEQQAQQECERKCSLLRRFAFSLTSLCQSSPRPLCAKLYRLWHSQP